MMLFAMMLASQAFAYGHSVSTGEGFICRLEVVSKAPLTCVKHVSQESKPEPILRDVTGQKYTTVFQTIDNPECIESTVGGTFAPVLGDATGLIVHSLEDLSNEFKTSAPRYHNNSGTIDTEERGGVLYYLQESVDIAAAARDQALLMDAYNNLIGDVVAKYRSGVLTLMFNNHVANFPVHFEAGASSRDPGFTATLTRDLGTDAGRRLTANLRCSPISQHAP